MKMGHQTNRQTMDIKDHPAIAAYRRAFAAYSLAISHECSEQTLDLLEQEVAITWAEVLKLRRGRMPQQMTHLRSDTP